MDLAARPALRDVEFHCGVFYDQDVGSRRFDLVTMWHFLEHDYAPLRSLICARDALKDDGRLIVEVPRLDSLTFRLFGDRWPGLQAPQHTALYDRTALLKLVERADLEVVDYLPYGAFPPYFYFFCGVAFRVSKGRGLNMGRAIYPYFAGQPGAVHVHLKKAIDTSRWRLDDLVSNTHAVRRRFIQWHHEHRGEEPVRAGRRTPVAAAAAS